MANIKFVESPASVATPSVKINKKQLPLPSLAGHTPSHIIARTYGKKGNTF